MLKVHLVYEFVFQNPVLQIQCVWEKLPAERQGYPLLAGLQGFALNNYYELLAAKYAQAYVEMVARDVNAALDNYLAGTQSELYSQELKRLKEEIIQLRAEINTSIATTYQRTNVAYNIAMEVNQMERTLHSNMSQSLRQSVNFANSLQ